jgi:hypothetical protein
MPAGFTGCKPKAWCYRFELAFSQVRPDEKKESAIAFLKDAVTYYRSLGMKITSFTLTVVALGPMLSASDRFRFLEKNRRWCGAIFHARSQRRHGMVDGLGTFVRNRCRCRMQSR